MEKGKRKRMPKKAGQTIIAPFRGFNKTNNSGGKEPFSIVHQKRHFVANRHTLFSSYTSQITPCGKAYFHLPSGILFLKTWDPMAEAFRVSERNDPALPG